MSSEDEECHGTWELDTQMPLLSGTVDPSNRIGKEVEGVKQKQQVVPSGVKDSERWGMVEQGEEAITIAEMR